MLIFFCLIMHFLLFWASFIYFLVLMVLVAKSLCNPLCFSLFCLVILNYYVIYRMRLIVSLLVFFLNWFFLLLLYLGIVLNDVLLLRAIDQTFVIYTQMDQVILQNTPIRLFEISFLRWIVGIIYLFFFVYAYMALITLHICHNFPLSKVATSIWQRNDI